MTQIDPASMTKVELTSAMHSSLSKIIGSASVEWMYTVMRFPMYASAGVNEYYFTVAIHKPRSYSDAIDVEISGKGWRAAILNAGECTQHGTLNFWFSPHLTYYIYIDGREDMMMKELTAVAILM